MPPTDPNTRSPRRTAALIASALLATALVVVLPPLALWAVVPSGSVVGQLLALPGAVVLSVVAAGLGSSLWRRSPHADDVLFADLLPWGLVRRLRAERRLARVREVVRRAPAEGSRAGLRRLERSVALLEATDASTSGHSRRVARHAELIAHEMGLVPAEVARVRTAAALHDLGKVHVPRPVLHKPGRLTDAEFALVRRHPEDGAALLAPLADAELAAMVRDHHERLDGSGYPSGLPAGSIGLGARIIAVADTFDALTVTRSYRPGTRHQRALDVLEEEAGVRLDAAVVRAFRACYAGRRSVALSALVATGPPRALAWLEGSWRGVTAAAAGAVPATSLAGTAALLALPVAPGPPADRGGQVAAERPAAAARPAGEDVTAVLARPARTTPDTAVRARVADRRRASGPGPSPAGAAARPPAVPAPVVAEAGPVAGAVRTGAPVADAPRPSPAPVPPPVASAPAVGTGVVTRVVTAVATAVPVPVLEAPSATPPGALGPSAVAAAGASAADLAALAGATADAIAPEVGLAP